MAAATMEDLFGDSDEDAPPAQAEPAAAKPTMEDLFGDEEEEEPQPAAGGPSMEALFGEEDDEPDAARDDKGGASMQDLFGSDSDNDKSGEEDEDAEDADRQPEPEPIQRQLIEAPELPRPSTEQLSVMRLPQFLGVKTDPFDPALWTEESDLDAGTDAAVGVGRENIVRWRWHQGPDGVPVRQSNTRLVKWSDGSIQLMIGNERMDVIEEAAPKNMQLWGRHDASNVLECHGMVRRKLLVKTGGLTSSAHRRMSARLEKENETRHRGAKVVIVNENPEAEHERKERERDELIKSREQLAAKQDSLRKQWDPMDPGFLEDTHGRTPRDPFGRQRGGRTGVLDDDSEEEEEEGIGVLDDDTPRDTGVLDDDEHDVQEEPAELPPDPEAEEAEAEDDDDEDEPAALGNRARKRQRIDDDDEDDE